MTPQAAPYDRSFPMAATSPTNGKSATSTPVRDDSEEKKVVRLCVHCVHWKSDACELIVAKQITENDCGIWTKEVKKLPYFESRVPEDAPVPGLKNYRRSLEEQRAKEAAARRYRPPARDGRGPWRAERPGEQAARGRPGGEAERGRRERPQQGGRPPFDSSQRRPQGQPQRGPQQPQRGPQQPQRQGAPAGQTQGGPPSFPQGGTQPQRPQGQSTPSSQRPPGEGRRNRHRRRGRFRHRGQGGGGAPQGGPQGGESRPTGPAPSGPAKPPAA